LTGRVQTNYQGEAELRPMLRQKYFPGPQQIIFWWLFTDGKRTQNVRLIN